MTNTPAISIPEDEDVLSSIRTVREILDDMEFGCLSVPIAAAAVPTTTTTTTTPTSPTNSSWKTQVFQLKQQQYEQKLQYETKLNDQKQQILRLERQVAQYQNESDLDRTMRSTLEKTLEEHNTYTRTLAKQLDQSKAKQKQIEEQLESFRQNVDDSTKAVETERSTTTELIEHIKLENDAMKKRLGEEEAARLRAEQRLDEIKQKLVQVQQQMKDDEIHSKETVKHLQTELDLTKKTLQEKINLLTSQLQKQRDEYENKLKQQQEKQHENQLQQQQEKQQQQQEKQQQQAEKSDDSSKDIGTAKMKLLQLKLKRLEETNEALKKDAQERTTKLQNELKEEKSSAQRYKGLYDEAEEFRKKLADQLKKIIKERKSATASTAPDDAEVTTTNLIATPEYIQRSKEVMTLQQSLSQGSNIVQSLESQIMVMEKAQPSKKVKDALVEKKKLLKEKYINHIKLLEEIENLHTLQVKEIHKQLDEATANLEVARKEWLATEQELAAATEDDKSDDNSTNTDLQAKTDAAAMRFSTARQHWQSIKEELEVTLGKLSDSRSRIADLKDSPYVVMMASEGDTVDADETTTTDESNSNPADKKRATPAARRQSKRQKTNK
jgi:hypothetical protein